MLTVQEPSEPDPFETAQPNPIPARDIPIDQPDRFQYRPALDGVRAIAVVAVLLYHGGVGWAQGGFLGVDLFFVLSGYLITTLLVTEFSGSGGIVLTQFWLRRARRLLPALVVVLVGCAIYATLFASPTQISTIRDDSLASLFYVANWRFIVSGTSYFDQFALPSPLRHMWSLAIEEQFYLIWPLVILGGLRVVGVGMRRWRAIWIGVLLVATAGSVALMAVVFGDGKDPSFAYYATFTRAQALFIGAALAFLLFQRDRLGRVLERVLVAVGVVGLLTSLVLFHLAKGTPAWMYHGGFTLMAVAGACLIAAASRQRRDGLTRVLALTPLPQIGLISYGLYLYHWPLFVVMTSERTHLDGTVLLLARLGATVAVSVASYFLLEMPIRKGVLRRARPVALTGVALVATLLIVLVAGGSPGRTDAAGANSTGQETQVLAQPPPAPGDLRVLLVGDSVTSGFANYFQKDQVGGKMAIKNGAIIGCGYLEGERRSELGRADAIQNDCQDRPNLWQQYMDVFKPQISMMMPGSFEVFDYQVGDRRVVFGTDEYKQYFLSQMDKDIRVLAGKGSKVVILNVPCYHETVQGGFGDPNPERRDPSRSDYLNGLLQQVAESHKSLVRVLDLHGLVCPTGTYQEEVNGVKVLRDGVHFTSEGADMVWKWLAPQLKDIVPPAKPGSSTSTTAGS